MATIATASDNDVAIPMRLVGALAELRQRLHARLTNRKGTWALDTDVGIPYTEHMDDGVLTLDQLSAEMTRAIVECPGVRRVERVTLSFDQATGEATYAAEVTPTDNVLAAAGVDAALLSVTTVATQAGLLRAYVRTGGIT